MIEFVILVPNTAAINSKQGILIVFSGATFVFAAQRTLAILPAILCQFVLDLFNIFNTRCINFYKKISFPQCPEILVPSPAEM
jgi:hypothetical protein